MASGEAGQPIGRILPGVFAGDRRDLLQRGDDADYRTVAAAARSYAQGRERAVLLAAGGGSVHILAGQCAVLQCDKTGAGARVKGIVPLPGEQCVLKLKNLDPGRIGRDVMQAAIEHGDGGRNILDELRDPVRRRRFRLATEARR